MSLTRTWRPLESLNLITCLIASATSSGTSCAVRYLGFASASSRAMPPLAAGFSDVFLATRNLRYFDRQSHEHTSSRVRKMWRTRLRVASLSAQPRGKVPHCAVYVVRGGVLRPVANIVLTSSELEGAKHDTECIPREQ